MEAISTKLETLFKDLKNELNQIEEGLYDDDELMSLEELVAEKKKKRRREGSRDDGGGKENVRVYEGTTEVNRGHKRLGLIFVTTNGKKDYEFTKRNSKIQKER
ncbi:hypothetical protein Tco_1454752 [Tanacetum coccineum]